ncbi:amphiregulin [Gracilinanus agilis]|uniref:amphiregulin n=1 Tax=Gracilinanus agilis TaxID=191870 RepID=UPI001CFCF5E5|nr:amphiregulin [Gracilinanus agilis]
MRAPPQPPAPLTPSPIFLSLLVLSTVCHHVAAADTNDTSPETNDLFSGDHSADGFELPSVSEVFSGSEMSSGTEYDYSEEYEEDPQLSGYFIDDSIRVGHLVKPKKNRTESEKNSDKTRRKKNRGKKRKPKKKVNPCDAKYQSFCIHGECKYIESLEAVTCKCHQNYFGERCGEQSMKTHSLGDGGHSVAVLAIMAAFLSVLCFSAIVVMIIQIRKVHSNVHDQEAEERKHLRQENGNGPISV